VAALCEIQGQDSNTVALPDDFGFTAVDLEANHYFPTSESVRVNERMSARTLGGLPPGEYSLRARSQHHLVQADSRFVVLSSKDYETLWLDIAKEQFEGEDRIYTVSDLMAALNDLIHAQKLMHPTASALGARLDFDLQNRLGSLSVETLAPSMRAPFEWFHHHVLGCAFAEVFTGGTIACSLIINPQDLIGEIVATNGLGWNSGERPRFLMYLSDSMPLRVKLDWHRLSDYQVKIAWEYSYKS